MQNQNLNFQKKINCMECGKYLLVKGDGFLSSVLPQSSLVVCSFCDTPIHIDLFPAMESEISIGKTGQTIMMGNEASCFYHPRKKAVVPCSSCGRFLCDLCDLDFHDQHLCPVCTEKGKKKNQIICLETNRILYDNIALGIALIPMTFIFWFLAFFSAPAAIFMVIRYWNAPISITPRSKVRFVMAFTLASFQIIGCSYFIFSVIK